MKQVETCLIQQHEDGHFLVYSDILIDAPKEKVWQVLSDFESMKEWSSTMVNITGEIKPNGKIQSHFNFGGQIWVADHNFIYEEGELFGWSDPLSGDFNGNQDNHIFKLEAVSQSQTRFIQTDEFTGPNAFRHSLILARIAFDSYPKFNRDLANRISGN
jgi:hypothetical protein